MTDGGDVTRLLHAYGEGDREAFDRLVPLVYDDLQRIARAQLRGRKPGQTLDTAGLVHDAYLRLVDQTKADFQDRQHFLAVCAKAMRQIVISNARRKNAAKRGGGDRPATLNEDLHGDAGRDEWLLALDEALERLAKRDERLGKVVECRFFAGYTEQETAEVLGASLRTVQRDWMRAKAWLREEMGEEPAA